MHDIDRTQLEMGWEAEPNRAGEFEYPGYETGGYELEGDEFDSSPELYGEAYDESYGEVFMETDGEGPFNEADELELAAELLEITNEAELDQFLGNLFRKVSQTVSQNLPPSIRGPLGGMLKSVARKYLPVASAALGNIIAPGVGGQLASAAGRMFGLELEGLSPEDQEFEVARSYVRMAGDAAQQATAAPPNARPQAVVQQALAAAAQRHAPGLVAGAPASAARPVPTRLGRRKARSGRWVRRGNIIILLGA